MARAWAFFGAILLVCACTRVSQQAGTVGGETQPRHSWSIPGTLRIAIQSPPNNLQGIFTR
ncbi:MAG: hypothetical protein JO359_07635, partial [Candidatus Eremiobacteraeota bacterium]|nr:hypothetical protein [Candidatus Eremiobacteraeota bacterium]